MDHIDNEIEQKVEDLVQRLKEMNTLVGHSSIEKFGNQRMKKLNDAISDLKNGLMRRWHYAKKQHAPTASQKVKLNCKKCLFISEHDCPICN